MVQHSCVSVRGETRREVSAMSGLLMHKVVRAAMQHFQKQAKPLIMARVPTPPSSSRRACRLEKEGITDAGHKRI